MALRSNAESQSLSFCLHIISCADKENRHCLVYPADCLCKIKSVNSRHHNICDNKIIQIIIHCLIGAFRFQASLCLKTIIIQKSTNQFIFWTSSSTTRIWIDVVKKPDNIKLYYPFHPVASFSCHAYRIQCRFIRTVSIGILIEDWFYMWF